MMVRGFVGSYGPSIGIIQGDPGALEMRAGPAAVNPSYLAASPDGGVVYAALEGDESGAVAAFAVNGDELRPLGARATGGIGTCHVSVHEGHVLCADYGSGTVAVFPVESDGSLADRTDLVKHVGSGPDPRRQERPHAHMVIPDLSGEYVLAVDLGTDTVYRYVLSGHRLTPAGAVSVPAGSGCRHLAFHPEGRYAYVVNELDSSVSVLDQESFSIGATIRTVSGGPASEPSAIRVSSDGRYCYVANRGPDTISTLEVLKDGSQLALVGTTLTGGRHPRDLVLHDEFLYVANQYSDQVATFGIDQRRGALEPVGQALHVSAPAAMLIL